jgi:hypothetical protein
MSVTRFPGPGGRRAAALRRRFVLALAVVALLGQSVPAMRAAPDAIVLCTALGTRVVALDPEGRPAAPLTAQDGDHCPLCRVGSDDAAPCGGAAVRAAIARAVAAEFGPAPTMPATPRWTPATPRAPPAA